MLDEQDEAKDDEPPLPAPCEPPSSEIQQTEEADGKMMEDQQQLWEQTLGTS